MKNEYINCHLSVNIPLSFEDKYCLYIGSNELIHQYIVCIFERWQKPVFNYMYVFDDKKLIGLDNVSNYL